MKKLTIQEAKTKIDGIVLTGGEPELALYLFGGKYMIIGYSDYVTFQRCSDKTTSGSGEEKYDSLDELFSATLIDDIVLIRDWHKISDFECLDLDLNAEIG